MVVQILPLCMMVHVEVQNLSTAGIGRHGKQRVVALSVQFGWQHNWSASQISISFPFSTSVQISKLDLVEHPAYRAQPTILAHIDKIVVIVISHHVAIFLRCPSRRPVGTWSVAADIFVPRLVSLCGWNLLEERSLGKTLC
jgi:hypothetical protein